MFVLKKTFGFWILLDILLGETSANLSVPDSVSDHAPQIMDQLLVIPPAEQLPQLLKILWRRSAAGLSLTSALLQLYACSCPVLYAAANSFPL